MKSLLEVLEGFGKVVAVVLVQPEQQAPRKYKRGPAPKAMGVEPVRKRRRRRTKAEMQQAQLG